MSSVKQLASSIIGDQNDLNQINKLLGAVMGYKANQDSEEQFIQAIKYLRKIFRVLMLEKQILRFENFNSFEVLNHNQAIPKHSKTGQDQIELESEISQFLAQKFQAFHKILLKYTFNIDCSEDIRVFSLRSLIELSRYFIHSINSEEQTPQTNIIIDDIVLEIVQSYSEMSCDQITIVLFEYSQKYYDFCNVYLQSLQKSIKSIQFSKTNEQLKKDQQVAVIQNVISILQDFPLLNNNQYKETFYIIKNKQAIKNSTFKQSKELKMLLKKRKNENIKSQKVREEESKEESKLELINKNLNQFQEFIFQVISVIKGNEDAELILALNTAKSILNNMQNPLLMSDYFLKIFNSTEDCDLQVVSLSIILILIGKFGLEYENYYHKLYKLIQNPEIFKCEQRQMFMKMIETSLKSQKIPLAVQSSFLKKFLQLSLTQAPNIILWILAITINTIKRNPTLEKMIDTKNIKTGIEDVFDKNELDIFNNNAENSHLWEIKTLKNHYLNEINKLIKVMGSNLQVANFLETEPFCDLLYKDFISLAIQTSLKKKQIYPIKDNIANQRSHQILNLEMFK